MEQQKYDRFFPDCMKGLAQYLDLHQRLHIRKLKMLPYKRNGEGKHVARNRESKPFPNAPSTCQLSCPQDSHFVVEHKATTRKQPLKTSMRIPIPKWGLKHHTKTRNVSLKASRLLRTSSIHHMSDEYIESLKLGLENPVIDATFDASKIFLIPPATFDELNFENQCVSNKAHIKSSSFCIMQPVELQEDTIFNPSKEFLAMMKLFNGNTELIQSILDDPSFIFAHYLQEKQTSDAEFRRSCSLPSPGRPERKLRIPHKRVEIESSLKSCLNNSSFWFARVEDDVPKNKIMDGDKERNRMNKKGWHRRISMDGILHKIPFGKKMLEGMKRSKFACRNGFVTRKFTGEGSMHASWNKTNIHIRESIKRSQSLNDSLHHYSHLYESISNEKSTKLPKCTNSMKDDIDLSACSTNAETLGKMVYLSDQEYCLPSKSARIEAPFENLTTEHRDGLLEKEESESLLTEAVIDYGGKPFLELEEREPHKIVNKLIEESLIVECNIDAIPQGEDLQCEPTKPAQICPTVSLSQEDASLNYLDHSYSEGSEFKDSLECLNLYGIEVKDLQLEDSELNGHDFLKAWHYPYQPLDLPTFYKVHNLFYDHNIFTEEHQLFIDLLKEAFVEIHSTIFCYFFPWPSHFNTKIRPMVIESQNFEKIWANVCWHGEHPVGVDCDGIADRHFVENDRWMNTQYDLEDVEQGLECLILNDLLDDVVLQLSFESHKFSSKI